MNSSLPKRYSRSKALLFWIVGGIGFLLLLGLLIPGIQFPDSVDQPRKAQAKVDSVQIATAIKAYYAEYQIYPLGAHGGDGIKPVAFIFGQSPDSPSVGFGVSNSELFDILRNIDSTGATPLGKPNPYNRRSIIFFDAKTATDEKHPRSGFVPANAKSPMHPGAYLDPWGTEYFIVISNAPVPGLLNLPYQDFQNENAPQVSVGVFSLGKDQQLGTKGDGFYKNPSKPAVSDDVISWQ